MFNSLNRPDYYAAEYGILDMGFITVASSSFSSDYSIITDTSSMYMIRIDTSGKSPGVSIHYDEIKGVIRLPWFKDWIELSTSACMKTTILYSLAEKGFKPAVAIVWQHRIDNLLI